MYPYDWFCGPGSHICILYYMYSFGRHFYPRQLMFFKEFSYAHQVYLLDQKYWRKKERSNTVKYSYSVK